MKSSRSAVEVGSASVVLGLLGLLAACSLETTGSGDFSLSADDDGPVEGEDSQDSDVEDPGSADLADDGDGNGDDDSGDGHDRDADTSEPGDAGSETTDGGPKASGKCQPGNYQGSFTCKQPSVAAPAWAAGLGGNEITGSFTFRLKPAGKASDSLELTGGTLHSADNAFFKLDANITATLECGRPLRGKLTEASYTGLFGAVTPFESPFDATYDEATSSFQDGTWVVKNDTITQCNGTWTATRSSD